MNLFLQYICSFPSSITTRNLEMFRLITLLSILTSSSLYHSNGQGFCLQSCPTDRGLPCAQQAGDDPDCNQIGGYLSSCEFKFGDAEDNNLCQSASTRPNNGLDVCFSHRAKYDCGANRRRRCCFSIPPAPTSRPTNAPTISPTLSPTESPTISEETIKQLYVTYPIGIIPDIPSFADDTNQSASFYKETPAAALVDEDKVKLALTQRRFIFSPVGFITELNSVGTRIVEFLIFNRNFATNGIRDYKIPKLVFEEDKVYIEKRPIDENDNRAYIQRHYGLVDRTAEGTTRGNILDHCLIRNADLPVLYPDSMEEICEAIPRCIGIVKGICIVATTVLENELVDATGNEGFVYIEKELRHSLFRSIENKPGGFVFALLIIIATQLVYRFREFLKVKLYAYIVFKFIRRNVALIKNRFEKYRPKPVNNTKNRFERMKFDNNRYSIVPGKV